MIDKMIFCVFQKQIDDIEEKQKSLQRITAPREESCPYLSDDNIKHSYDYFYPERRRAENQSEKAIQSECKSLIINVHGGAFSTGDKKYNAHYATFLASRGYQVVTLNYDLVPQVGLLEQIKQVAKGICYVCEKYAGNNDIYLTGDSSGSYVIQLLNGIWQQEEDRITLGLPKLTFAIKALGLTGAPGKIEIFPKFMFLFDRRFHEMIMFGCEGMEPYFDLQRYEKNDTTPAFFMSCEDDMYYKNCLSQEKQYQELGHKVGSCYIRHREGGKLFHCFNVIRPDLESSSKTNLAMLDFFESL